MQARRSLVILVVVLALFTLTVAPAGAQAPMTWAIHVTLAPTWFDPAEHTGIITIMKVLYAVHDAMVKPMPGNPMAPSLAESWTVSKDGLTYEFVVRKGVEHKPSSPGGAILMFEPSGTSTTGDRHEGELPDHVDSTTGHAL